MVVRGTKNFSDLITDAMMEASDYEYTSPNDKGGDIIKGKAHSGMQLSGKYLVDRHQKLLSTLLKLSKKRKLEVTLIGQSLGAGAASIAAMEWNSRQSFDEQGSDNNVGVSAHVIGFGCPAVLSKELSMATKEYITTVVADADFIPRMSGATLVNLLLDVTRFDYQKQAQRDVEQALRAAKSRLALGLDEDDIQTVMGYVSSGLEKIANPMTLSSTDRITTPEEKKVEGITTTEEVQQLPIVLFPPGECIHFYRDGSGISGSHVPCTFFDEIDIARTCGIRCV